MRTVLATLSVVALVLVGCDPSHSLAIENESDQPLVVRITDTTYEEDFGTSVSHFLIGPAENGYAFPIEIGPLEGTVEFLDADCEVVGSTPARGGSIVTIAEDLSINSRYPDEEGEIEGQLPTSDQCGPDLPVE